MPNFGNDEMRKELNGYLLRHNPTMFTADRNGGKAAALIARGTVWNAVRSGRVFDTENVPMEIPTVWKVGKIMKDQFPYSGDADESHPWRVGWNERL